MSLFNELKRRNVLRVGAAYVVTAWLLIQVAETIFPLFGFDDTPARVVVIVLAIGFIPAMVFAWAFELTPEGLRKESEVDRSRSISPHAGKKLDRMIMVVLALAVVYFAFDKFVLDPQREAVQQQQTAEQLATATEQAHKAGRTEALVESYGEKSIAVLPFVNMSDDASNEYFSDGISEELLNLLTKIEQLRVIARTSSFSFKGQDVPISEIAQSLNVAHVLEGSVRKSGNRVRITAQLIDARSDTHLWSETYDRKLEDIFAIQDEIAGQITESLKVALALEQSQAPTSNVEAYTLYLQGRELFRRRGDSLAEADRLLRAAVKLDPDFAVAWATLAMVQITIPSYTKEPWAEFLAPTLEFAERALELEPFQADAMLAIGEAMIFQGKLLESLEQFDAVTERYPRHSQARLWYAISLFKVGYTTQAFEQLSIAMDLDPVHSAIIDWFARVAEASGKPELVVDSAKRSIQLGRASGRVPILTHYINSGSASDMEPFATVDERLGWIRWIFEVRDDPGRLPEALAWADQLEREGGGFLAEYTRFYFLMVAGSPEDFFKQVDRIQSVDDTIDVMVWMPAVKRHRQDKAMKTWARGRGYEALWRERGWPDRCRTVGDDDWECY